MRHRMRGRKLGRNSSHRKAMFRNMACSLIRSIRVDEDDKQKPRVPGRIVTTLPKAKELRPFVEKLVTLARKAAVLAEQAEEFSTAADRNTSEWKTWRDSQQWNRWNQAIAPALAMRRRAFSILRDREAVDILFDELAERFEDRPGGYTRVVRLAKVRLGDAGQQALIEFVGDRDRDRVKTKRKAPVVADEDEEQPVAEESAETGAVRADEIQVDGAQAVEEDASEAQAPADDEPEADKKSKE